LIATRSDGTFLPKKDNSFLQRGEKTMKQTTLLVAVTIFVSPVDARHHRLTEQRLSEAD
jgi:hypothetical protein